MGMHCLPPLLRTHTSKRTVRIGCSEVHIDYEHSLCVCAFVCVCAVADVFTRKSSEAEGSLDLYIATEFATGYGTAKAL